MDGFSYERAIGAGFRVIGRKPLAVLFWAATHLVLVALPVAAVLVLVLPNMLAAFQEAAQYAPHARPFDPARMMALQSRTFGWQPGIWLLQVIARTVVMGAVFRAVLEPENSRWGYLRFSRQELWLGLTYLVMMVMSFIMILILFVPLAIGGGIVAAVSEHGGGSAVGGALLLVLAGLAGFGAIIWVLLRLSLALPMSFHQGRFLLYESWDVTRGQAFKMFLVFLVLMLGLLVVEGVLVAIIGTTVFHQVRGAAPWGAFLHGAQADIIHRLGPAILGLVVVGSVVAMAIHAILVAPLAEIYRELTADTASAV